MIAWQVTWNDANTGQLMVRHFAFKEDAVYCASMAASQHGENIEIVEVEV